MLFQILYRSENTINNLNQCSITGFSWIDNALKEAWIENGWLITILRFGLMGHIKLCLESVERITDK